MKKFILPILTVMLMAGCVPAEETIDIEKEKEAIKAVIEELMVDRTELDYEGWINAFVDEPYSFVSWAGKDGHSFMYLDDWKKQSEEDFANLLQSQIDGGYSINIEPVDITIKVYKESAWAHFKNKWTKVFEENEETEDLGETFLIVSFEKHNGEWKIAYFSAVISNSYAVEDSDKEEDPDAKE